MKKKEIILNTSKPFYEVLIEEFKNEKKTNWGQKNWVHDV